MPQSAKCGTIVPRSSGENMFKAKLDVILSSKNITDTLVICVSLLLYWYSFVAKFGFFWPLKQSVWRFCLFSELLDFLLKFSSDNPAAGHFNFITTCRLTCRVISRPRIDKQYLWKGLNTSQWRCQFVKGNLHWAGGGGKYFPIILTLDLPRCGFPQQPIF